MKKQLYRSGKQTFHGFESILSESHIKGLTPTKIYRGQDHVCRCGCHGNYHDAGTHGFKLAMSLLKKFDIFHNVEIDEVFTHKEMCVNIPYGDPADDKCVTIYFDK